MSVFDDLSVPRVQGFGKAPGVLFIETSPPESQGGSKGKPKGDPL